MPLFDSIGTQMEQNKRAELEALILQLLEEKPEISVQGVAEAAGLEKSNESDRKAVRRALNALIERGVLAAQGAARARVYHLQAAVVKIPAELLGIFKDIPLSARSEHLLAYLSKPTSVRAPTAYQIEFLNAYEPNRTTYLSITERAELLAQGKVENVVRPAGTYARNILNRLLIDLSWNSSRLEGNTYSLLETKRLIELGESAEGKEASETQMILNHKNAIEYIVASVDDPQITSLDVYSIHALLSENLLGDPSASGRIRQISVDISGSTYFPLDNPHQLKECFDKFIKKLNEIDDPFEQSFFSIVHLSYLQAFNDVNKRTARLVANIPLIKKNLKPLSFIDVEQHAYANALLGVYEKNNISLLRDLYRWAYQRSSLRYSAIQQSLGAPNLLKLKYRNVIHDIIRTIILEKVEGRQVVPQIRKLIEAQSLSETDASWLFEAIETEILSLHEGNIASYKVRPSEFQAWQQIQARK
jgi:Fic family protein/predicted transcriptional regulator